MKYEIFFTKQAERDYQKVAASTLKNKVYRLLEVLESNPFQPPYEKLVDKTNTYSRRINIQHRLVYEVDDEAKTIKILRMWTHYGD